MADEPLDKPVAISYAALMQDDPSLLRKDVLKAFGTAAGSLGFLILTDLPAQFSVLREDALQAGACFAGLPETVREQYSDQSSSYSFGWSHGKELMNGKPDTLKGSYYANPVVDRTDAEEDVRQLHPTYLRANIWPSEAHCPGFKQAFKALASFMTETGIRLARVCDNLAASNSRGVSVEQLIASSQCSKARLLHYYPPADQAVSIEDIRQIQANECQKGSHAATWCGDHVDHSLLTGLVSAMYLFHPSLPLGSHGLKPIVIPAPTPSAGLFIRTRAGRVIKANIPPDCMAFQTGEALSLLTQNKLQPTPHSVQTGAGDPILDSVLNIVRKEVKTRAGWENVRQGVISRETMAVFLQPDINDVIGEKGETFGEYSNRIVSSHYNGLPDIFQY